MRAPRRLPWADKAELNEVYDLLFAPGVNHATKQRGLARINLYLSSPSCPSFLPLLHALITASLLPSPPTTPTEAVSTRMTLAMALVRFVNGMVDPLQTGPYARPISHIAASLGIPPLLISIRHRATHEDLPPLPLLVHCVNLAIDYLHHYALLPMLASSSDTSLPTRSSARAEGLVKRWKKAMKVRVREKKVGEENETGREMKRIKRDLELLSTEELAAALVGPSGVVPVAIKKRPGYKSTNPSPASMQVWLPLITHVQAQRPDFASGLAEEIVGNLLEAPAHIALDVEAAESAKRERQSYKWCLATWLIWIWQQPDLLDTADKAAMSRRVLAAMLSGDAVLKRLHRHISSATAARDLSQILADEESDAELEGLDDAMEEPDTAESQLAEMESRLKRLESRTRQTKISNPTPTGSSVLSSSKSTANGPPGWHKVPADQWREAPIGVWGIA